VPGRLDVFQGVSLGLDFVAGARVGQELSGNRADEIVLVEGAQLAGVADVSDRRAGELPPRADTLNGLEHLRPDDGDHAFLGLRDHDLPGLHPGLAYGDSVEVDVDPRAVTRHLGERRCEPGGAAVLQRLDETAFDELERGFDQLLARERVTDLDGRTLVPGLLAQLRAREHGGATDPVAAGRSAVEDDVCADRGRACPRHSIRGQQADAHRVDEAVVAVRLVEDRLAADGRDSDAVPVVADTGNRAAEVMIRFCETKAVEQCDRPRPHGNDVAQDPADAGRGALERFDRRGMVVRLDLEGDRLSVPEIDHARVLTGPLQDAFALGRKPLQQESRMLVAAMLGPEEREDGKLEVVRITAEQFADAVELLVGQPQRTVERLFRSDLRQGQQCTRGTRQAPATFLAL
jgi:hypothetical protein